MGRGHRMRRTLSRRRWVPRRGLCRVRRGYPFLFLYGAGADLETVLLARGSRWRVPRLYNSTADFLVCGDPQRWCAIALPAHDVLIVARRVRTEFHRRRIRDWFLR